MEEQLINNSILDQFINSHEQSYEEFLSTFTYLSKDLQKFSASGENKTTSFVQIQSKDVEEEGKTIQGCKKSLRKSFSTSEFSNGDKQGDLPRRSKEMLSLPPQMPNENEIVMNESWKSGGSDGNGLSLSERAKVDNCIEIDMDEKTCSAGSLVLPGEVEEIITCYTPVEKRVQRKFRTFSVQQPLNNKAQETAAEGQSDTMVSDVEVRMERRCGTEFLHEEKIEPIDIHGHWMNVSGGQRADLLGDDVQPFLLDEEFDYDNVALTPKFSEAELMAITELSEEKKSRQMSSPAGAEV